jgi:hypothetical protein
LLETVLSLFTLSAFAQLEKEEKEKEGMTVIIQDH